MFSRFQVKFALNAATIGAIISLSACDPIPRRDLSPEEKQADMMWLYSKFGANYAPLEYKASLWGTDFEALKEKYTAEAMATQSNEEFYMLASRFVSEFQDAHTYATFTPSGRKGREKVAYLGVSLRREGENLVVTKTLPTTSTTGIEFPLIPGTVISKVNGQSPRNYILKNLAIYSNIGQEESNFTAFAGSVAARLSTNMPIPAERDITFTIKIADEETDVVVPWIIKDYDLFVQEQQVASAQVAAQEKEKSQQEQEALKPFQISVLDSQASKTLFKLSFLNFDNNLISSFAPSRTRSDFQDRLNSFRIRPIVSGFVSDLEASLSDGTKAFQTPPEAYLRSLRNVPPTAMMIPDARVFPAYVNPEVSSDGKTTRLVGYILLDTFSPGREWAYSRDPVKDFKETLVKLQAWGVEDLVIDAINNGGGSLFLLSDLAQALSNKKIKQPSLQIGLNEGWIDSLEDASIISGTDMEREIYRRMYQEALTYKSQGLRITPKESPYSIESMSPFTLAPHKAIKKDFNIYLLVNEMCASACDIFSGVLQDNKMATLIGSRTMGAGGNVVNHWQAPNSNMDVSQTESLIVRSNGQYIENVGVTPEVQMVVSESAPRKYDDVRKKAIELIFKKHAPQSIRVSPTRPGTERTLQVISTPAETKSEGIESEDFDSTELAGQET